MKEEDLRPVWELLEPGAFLKYAVNYLTSWGRRVIKVLQIRDDIIEFLMSADGERRYFYVSKDRRYWVLINFVETEDEKPWCLKKRQSFEELEPTELFTRLW
ncbi:MAG: hypothetical protein QXF61_09500 [Nitrososphaeria archaeon]